MMVCRRILFSAVLVSVVVICGCAASDNAADTAKNAQLSAMPSKFDHAPRKSAQLADRWWETFGSSELNNLIENMFRDNLQIAQSYEGLRALSASYRVTRSGSALQLNARAQAGGNYSEAKDATDTYGLSLNASYEADLWGRLKNGQRADIYALLAGKYDTETLYMTLAASMAEQYTDYVTYSRQLSIKKQSEKLYSDRLEARERLYRSGIGSMNEVLEAKKSLETVQNDILTVSKNIEDAKSAIALLLGRADTDFKLIVQDIKVPRVPETVPALVAVQRPDIRSALADVAKTDSTLAAAAARRYPTLSFTASAGYTADNLQSLVTPENFAAQLIGGLVQPILNGGAITAEIDRQKAYLQRDIYAYQQTVLTALNETRKALSANYYAERTLESQISRFESDFKLNKLAKMRYEKGIDDYEAVLNTLITLAERAYSVETAKGQTILTRVGIIRSIGGDWTGATVEKRMDDDVLRLFSEVSK